MSSVLVFRRLVLLNEGESSSEECMWMKKRQKIRKMLTNQFSKLLRHQCWLLAMGDRAPPYFKELISWVVSAVLGSIITAPEVRCRYICPRYKPPRAFSIPDEQWWWKTWHELMFNCLLRSQVDPVVSVMNCYQSPGWCFKAFSDTARPQCCEQWETEC